MNLRLQLVVAMCKQNRGIGINNSLPWKLKGDMEFFKQTTLKTSEPCMKNAIIMGRKTWDSIPGKMKPLKNRFNIVLSQTLEMSPTEDLEVVKSFEEALQCIEEKKNLENVYVIGGYDVFEAALKHKSCYRIYLTEVLKEYQCDTFFPEFSQDKFIEMRLPWIDSSIREEGDTKYRITCYQKVDSDMQPTKLIKGVHSYIIAAFDTNRGMGYEGNLPWPSLSKDLWHYRNLLRGTEASPSVAIIGRISWDSMVAMEKNFKEVLYVVVSRTKTLHDYPECCCVVRSFEDVVRVTSCLVKDEKASKICFLGGHDLYKNAIDNKLCDRLYLTRIHHEFPCDVYFPEFEHAYSVDGNRSHGKSGEDIIEENGIRLQFEEYKRTE